MKKPRPSTWTPLRAKLEEILADGAWHSTRELLLACGDAVTPEKARRNRFRGKEHHVNDPLLMKRELIQHMLRVAGYPHIGEGWQRLWKKTDC